MFWTRQSWSSLFTLVPGAPLGPWAPRPGWVSGPCKRPITKKCAARDPRGSWARRSPVWRTFVDLRRALSSPAVQRRAQASGQVRSRSVLCVLQCIVMSPRAPPRPGVGRGGGCSLCVEARLAVQAASEPFREPCHSAAALCTSRLCRACSACCLS